MINNLIANWVYIIITVSFFYWMVVLGMYLFPSVPPFFISIIVVMIVYYFTRQRNIILFI